MEKQDPIPPSAWSTLWPWFFVVACALLPWALSWALHPDELPGVRVIYRDHDGDNEYLPFIHAISQGNFGEPSVLETHGQGVMGFPFASVAPLALCLALFGTFWGYVIADVLIGLAFFALLRAWARQFTPSGPWPTFVAAAYICIAPSIIYFPGPLSHLDQLFTLWGPRLPRPFVTDLYYVAGLTLLAWMVRLPRRRGEARNWLAAGALVGLTANSYIFHTLTLAPTVFVAWLWAWRTDRWPMRRAAIQGLGAGGAAAVFAIPFLLQRLYASPDYAARLGVFPVSRWRFALGGDWAPNIYFPVTLLLIAFWIWAQRRWMPPVERVPGIVFGLLATAVSAAYFGAPLMAILLGELVLPYHFAMVVRATANATMVALVAAWGPWLAARLSLRPWVLPTGLALAFLLAVTLQLRWNRLPFPVRDDMYRYPGNYRVAFSRLTHELESPRYAHDRVMGTLDGQVYAYWVAFMDRNSFCPDTAFSPADPQMVEERMLLFLRELRTPPAELGPLMDHGSLLAFWFESARYQCSPIRMVSTVDDYAPRDVWWVGQPRPWHAFGRLGECWWMALPLSRQAALRAHYESLLATPPLGAAPRLDLIVLNADQDVVLGDPDPARYELTYHDPIFRVWQLRP